MEALERITKTVEGKERGQGGRVLVEVDPADVAACCDAVGAAEQTQVVKDLRQGANGHRPGAKVYVQADDLFHLAEKVPQRHHSRRKEKDE